MAKGAKTKTTMSPYLRKRKKVRGKKRNGMQKMAAMQGVADRMSRGFQRK